MAKFHQYIQVLQYDEMQLAYTVSSATLIVCLTGIPASQSFKI